MSKRYDNTVFYLAYTEGCVAELGMSRMDAMAEAMRVSLKINDGLTEPFPFDVVKYENIVRANNSGLRDAIDDIESKYRLNG